MDTKVKNFLKSVANTVLKLEILSYYHDHPFAMDNAAGIARWLNRRVEDVAADLGELVKGGVFTRESDEEDSVITFSPDERTGELIDKVVSSYRLTREAVYAEVLALQQKQDDLRKEYQKILFTERGKTETILNSLEEAVLVTSRQARVLLANGRFMERFAAARADSPSGTALEKLVGEGPVAGAVHSSIAKMGEDEPGVDFSHEERFYRVQSQPVTGPDGKIIADEDGTPVAYVTVLRDMTRDREIERMREDFISMLTHDLKNPLGIILGSSTLVLDGKVGLLNKKQHKLLSNVVKGCGLMERLIEDFLTLSKLEAGQLKLDSEEVDINELLQSTLQFLNPQFAEKQLNVSYSTECKTVRVLADPIQLERVVSNLLANAIKYNQEGGRIDVSAIKEGDKIRVDVADTGKGIAAEELPFVFDKFRRACSVESMKGTGLGLAIARELISAMGGEIWAKSELGKGSVFSFRLPRAVSPA